MSEEASHHISTRIDQKLAGLSKASSDQLIFRIDHILRRANEGAYEPEMVSIGPYHRGKNNLQKMEKYKLEYLQEILKRENEASAERYIAVLVEDEAEARSCYAEYISLSRDDFVEMMLLDGCFIIEFLRKYDKDAEEVKDDPIFKMEWVLDILCRDLLLFENQLPFFILVKLFDMTKIPDQEEDLISLAISCLNDCMPVDMPLDESAYDIMKQPENVFHLLSLMYVTWCSSFAETIEKENEDEEDRNSSSDQKRSEFSSVTLKRVSSKLEQEEDPIDIKFIRSVCELKQDGVKFTKLKQSTSWLDIKFESGEIKIPPLAIQDTTESVLRNLIAYEQYMFDSGYSRKFVTDYTTFMDCLMNTPQDVKMLRHKEIIISWLGNDEAIADMFNKIGNNVFLCAPEFSYRKLFKKVNEHCSKRRNPWFAELKEKYFKNPWSIISFLAATLLLLLTLIQTIFSILQHVKKDPKVVCKCK